MNYFIEHCSQCGDTVLLEDLIPSGVLCERCGRIGNKDSTMEVKVSNEYLLSDEEINKAWKVGRIGTDKNHHKCIAQAQLDKCKPLIIEMVFKEIKPFLRTGGARDRYLCMHKTEWQFLKRRLLEEGK